MENILCASQPPLRACNCFRVYWFEIQVIISPRSPSKKKKKYSRLVQLSLSRHPTGNCWNPFFRAWSWHFSVELVEQENVYCVPWLSGRSESQTGCTHQLAAIRIAVMSPINRFQFHAFPISTFTIWFHFEFLFQIDCQAGLRFTCIFFCVSLVLSLGCHENLSGIQWLLGEGISLMDKIAKCKHELKQELK